MKKRETGKGPDAADRQLEESIRRYGDMTDRVKAQIHLRDLTLGPAFTEREQALIDYAVKRAQEEMYDKLLRSGVI
jgi:hypothetical protein